MTRKFISNKRILSYFKGKTLNLKVDGKVVKMKLKDIDSISEEGAEEIVGFLIASLEDKKLVKLITSLRCCFVKGIQVIEEKATNGVQFLKCVSKKLAICLNLFFEKCTSFYHNQIVRFYRIQLKKINLLKRQSEVKREELLCQNKLEKVYWYRHLEKFKGILFWCKNRLSIENNQIHNYSTKRKYKKLNRKTVFLKGTKIILSVSIIFSMCMFGGTKSFAAENKLTQLITGKNTSSDIFIGGNYIELGISNIGSFGSVGRAPSHFHNNSSSLLPRTNSAIGMIANENGWFSGIKSKTIDFFMPGIIDESWSVGINGKTTAIASAACSSSSYPSDQNLDNGFNTSVLYDSDNVKPIGARTIGTLYGGKVQLTQDIILGVDDKLYTTNVTLKNISGTSLTNMRYMRAFDPDQNSGMESSGMYTHNYVQNIDGKSAKVTAYGKYNQAPFIFYAADSRAKAGYARNGTSDVFYFTDIYNTKNYMKTANTSGLDGTTNYMDGDIFIYFDLGDIKNGEETKLTYYSSLDSNVQMSSDKIDAKAVEDFIEETVPEAEDIKSDTISIEKPKVDEAKEKFDDLNETAKAEVPSDSKDKLNEAIAKVDSIIKEDYIESIVSGLKDIPDSKEDFTTYEDLEKLEEVKKKKEEYDKLVEKDSKDTWLTPDKFKDTDGIKFDEVKDAFSKLDNLEKDIPSVSEVKTYDVIFNVSGEQTKSETLKIIEGKSYTYSVVLGSNERIKEVSENAVIQGNNEVTITNVKAGQSVNIVTENIVKEQLLSNLAKILDTINVASGTNTGTQLSLLASALDSGVEIVFPLISGDLFALEGVNVKVSKVHNAKDPLKQTFTITLSKNGESVTKDIQIVFEGDSIVPIIEKLTTDTELNQPDVSKALKFKVSDVGTGIDPDSIKVTSYLNPEKNYPCTSLGNGEYSFTVEESDGYEITVKDFAKNEAITTYIVNSIDKTKPIIQGVENGKDYYLQHTIIIKDQNLETVTVNGTTYTDFEKDGDFKTKKIVVKDIGSYTVQATDGANPIDVSFNIVNLPSELDDFNAAIKTMRDELAGQQTVLTSAEYEKLDQDITAKEASINDIVISNFESEFNELNTKYTTITKYDQRTEFDALLKEVNDGTNYYGKLTDSIHSKRETLISKIGAKLQPIRDEQAKIDNIAIALLNYSENTISSKDKGTIENYQTQLKAINVGLIGTGESSEKLNNAKTKVSALLAAIDKLTTDINKLDESISSLTSNTVKSSNKAVIEKAITDLKSYKITKTDRLSVDEINLIDTKLNNAEGLLTRIKEVAKIISDNKAVIEAMTVEKVTPKDYEDVRIARANIEAIKGNLTTDESNVITALDAHIAKLKLKIDLDSIKDIDITIKDLTVENVKETSRDTIQAVIVAIDDIPDATSEQESVLAQKKANANELIAKLNQIKIDIQTTKNKLKEINLKNVKSENKTVIDSAISEVDSLLKTYQNNLTTEQITELNGIKIEGKGLLDKISEVATKIDAIKVASELNNDTITTTHSDQVTVALGYITAIQDNLTDAEKTTVTGYKTVLNALEETIKGIEGYLNELEELSSKTIKDISTEIIGRIDAVLVIDKTNHLTAEQKTLVQQQKQKIEEVINQVNNVGKTITDIEALLSEITEKNVKTSDKGKVVKANQLINEFPYDMSVLTSDQKEEFDDVSALANKLSERIKYVEDELLAINNVLKDLTENTVKVSHKDSIQATKEKIQALLNAHNTSDVANLIQSQIDALDGEMKTHIPALEAKIKKAEDDIKAFEDALAGLGLKSSSKARSVSLSIDNVTADNETEINDTMDKAQAVIDNGAVDESVKDEAREILDQLKALKQRIQDVKDVVSTIANGLDDLRIETITSDHQDKITKVTNAIDTFEKNYTGNVTDGQKSIVSEEKTKVEEFTTILKEVQDAMQKIEEDLSQLTPDTIKDTQKDELNELKGSIDKVKEDINNHLSENEKKQFDSYNKVIVDLNKKIEDLESALQDIKDANKDLTVDKVNVSDKDKINSVNDKINDIHNDYKDNLTQDNKDILNKKKDLNDSLLEQIEVIVDLNEKLSKIHNLDMNADEMKEYFQSLLDIYNKLSETQKKYLDSKEIEYCQDIVDNGVTNSISKDSVEVVGKGNTQFVNGTEVEVKDILGGLQDNIQKNVNTSLKSHFDGYELIALYDVKLVYKGEYIQPDGKVMVVLQLPTHYKGLEEIKAVYVDDNGNITEYPYEIKDGYIYIETDHFSYYGILAKKKAPVINDETITESQTPSQTESQTPSQTADMSQLELYTGMILISLAGWIVLKRKKEMM